MAECSAIVNISTLLRQTSKFQIGYSWLQGSNSLAMLVHSRNRMMLMRDDPSALDLAQPDGQAEIQPYLLTVGSGFRATHRRNDKKRHRCLGRDAHLSDFVGNCIARPGKK